MDMRSVLEKISALSSPALTMAGGSHAIAEEKKITLKYKLDNNAPEDYIAVPSTIDPEELAAMLKDAPRDTNFLVY